MRVLRPLCLAIAATLATCAAARSQSRPQPPPSMTTMRAATPTQPVRTGQSTLVMPSLPAPVDPTALALIHKAMAAMGAHAGVKDVTLTGNATRTAGSDVETGSITLKALGTRFSRVDLASAAGNRTELRGADTSGKPQNLSLSPDGTNAPVAGHNAMTDAVWFFPALSSLSKDPAKYRNLAISYVGREQKAGVAVEHIHFVTELPHPAAGPGPKMPVPDLSRLTATDIYLDASSDLPVALAFNTHPDKNSLIDIPVEVDFSNYQPVQGVQVPFHIQKYMNGTLFLDVTVQSATIDSGLAAAEFAAQ